jgi:hypothetical protein
MRASAAGGTTTSDRSCGSSNSSGGSSSRERQSGRSGVSVGCTFQGHEPPGCQVVVIGGYHMHLSCQLHSELSLTMFLLV